jgi:hypothetical protein
MKPILFHILRAFLLHTNLKTGYTPPQTERTYRFALRFLLLPLIDISVAIIGNNLIGLVPVLPVLVFLYRSMFETCIVQCLKHVTPRNNKKTANKIVRAGLRNSPPK